MGSDPKGLRPLDDEIELAGHFDDKKALEAHFHGIQAKIDELRVLVAVADEAGLLVAHVRQRGHQLRLAAHFQAMMISLAEPRDLFHNLLLLVDLDGVDATILALVVELFHGLPE
jgi:hypothetical protein